MSHVVIGQYDTEKWAALEKVNWMGTWEDRLMDYMLSQVREGIWQSTGS